MLAYQMVFILDGRIRVCILHNLTSALGYYLTLIRSQQ